MLFDLFDSAHIFELRGQLYVVKVIYQSSGVIVSKQMTDPPLSLPLELPYLLFHVCAHNLAGKNEIVQI
jgi:hypothetical protein